MELDPEPEGEEDGEHGLETHGALTALEVDDETTARATREGEVVLCQATAPTSSANGCGEVLGGVDYRRHRGLRVPVREHWRVDQADTLRMFPVGNICPATDGNRAQCSRSGT